MDSIVTLTMNPALDITTDADVVRPTDKVRCSRCPLRPGRRRRQRCAGRPQPRCIGARRCFPRAARPATFTAISLPRGGSRSTASRSPVRHAKVSLSTRSAPACNTGSCSRALPDVCRTTAMPRRTPPPGHVGQVCCGERKSAAGCTQQFLPAGGSGLPGSRRAVGSGHFRRWPQTHHLRGVPAEGERARTTGMRRARTRHGIRADGRRSRNRRLLAAPKR